MSPAATCSRPAASACARCSRCSPRSSATGNNHDVITAAQAIEITHLASLYHDDVMDEAQMRRGVPSAQTVWGNSVAILTGDLLFARASKLIASARRAGPPHAGRHLRAARASASCTRRSARATARTRSSTTSRCSPTRPARSSPRAALVGRHLLGRARGVPRSRSSSFGEKIGVAFQLIDDVIDLSPSPRRPARSPGTDLRAGVATLPLLYLRRAAEDRCRMPPTCSPASSATCRAPTTTGHRRLRRARSPSCATTRSRAIRSPRRTAGPRGGRGPRAAARGPREEGAHEVRRDIVERSS